MKALFLFGIVFISFNIFSLTDEYKCISDCSQIGKKAKKNAEEYVCNSDQSIEDAKSCATSLCNVKNKNNLNIRCFVIIDGKQYKTNKSITPIGIDKDIGKKIVKETELEMSEDKLVDMTYFNLEIDE